MACSVKYSSHVVRASQASRCFFRASFLTQNIDANFVENLYTVEKNQHNESGVSAMDEQERKFREAYAKKRAEEIARSHDPAYLQERTKRERDDQLKSDAIHFYYRSLQGFLGGIFYLFASICLGFFFSWTTLIVMTVCLFTSFTYFLDARRSQAHLSDTAQTTGFFSKLKQKHSAKKRTK